MNSDLFRIILLVAGVVLVLGLFGWDRYKNRSGYRQPPRPRGREADDVPFDSVDRELGLIEQVIREDGFDEFGVGEPYVVSRRSARVPAAARGEASIQLPDTAQQPRSEPLSEPPSEPAAEPERILALTLRSRGGTISGIRLRRAFNEQRLTYGPMSIYHRREEDELLFSVANLVVPGTFDPSTMDGFSTPGVVLFVTLPGPRDPLHAFETMLGSARQMASRLDAELCDARRRPLDEVALEALRAEAGRVVA